MASSEGRPVFRASAVDAVAVHRWVADTCGAQGVPVKVSSDLVLKRVAVLLSGGGVGAKPVR